MLFVYLDEFGHIGPYISRTDKRYNTSPIFGLAGLIIPEERVRDFGTCFLKLKQSYLEKDPSRKGKPFYEWEKKGTNLFTASSIDKYSSVKDCAFRLLNEVKSRNGKIIFKGREKIRGSGEGLNPNGLYKTVFADMIRALDNYSKTIDEKFVIVIDQNSARKELLETASKTMYGKHPSRNMICPPFEVESHINQQVQAADWIATIVGRIWNYKFENHEFEDVKNYDKYFNRRINEIKVKSSIQKRQPPVQRESSRPETAISAAFKKARKAT